MPNTLGLDDDWEPVDVVYAIEGAFNVKFADKEVEAIFTVGEMFDLLLKKITPATVDRKCATAMTFYRLRRSLASRTSTKLTPSSDLSWLQNSYTKEKARSIEGETGLRLPKPTTTWRSHLAPYVLLAGIVSSFIAVAFDWHVAALLLFGGMTFGALAARFDPGRLPKDCDTLGDLSKKAANLSYGLLIEQGADASDQRIWQVLVEVLSDFASVPSSEINRDTYFLASTFKKAKAAA